MTGWGIHLKHRELLLFEVPGFGLSFGRVLFQGTDLEVRVEEGVWGFGFHE